MQLPDEAIVYEYQSLLQVPNEEWSPATEMRAKHFLSPARLKGMMQQMMQIRSQVAAERDMQVVPPEQQPLLPGFIDLPQRMLDAHRRKGEASDLGKIISLANRLRENVDRVIILGIGGSTLGAKALFDGLRHSYHNELPPKVRMGVPRIYFEGNNLDNDSLQEMLDLMEHACVDPELRDERWGMIVVSKSGTTLETGMAYRLFRKEAARFYGSRSEQLHQLFLPITGTTSKLRDLGKAEGIPDADILPIPDNIGGRYAIFTAAGLLPAAVMGLDVRALLLGAAAMTRRFVEEGFERNPALQFAAVNYLVGEECDKPTRVMSVWSKKLEGLGHWYDQLIAEGLGKHGRGPTPLTTVQTRDLHARGQQFHEGIRDKMFNHVIVKTPRTPPITMGMADHNEDDLNVLNRKTYPDVQSASYRSVSQAAFDSARPSGTLVLPALSEHTVGQLMQMLMLATVVEGRLMGINPYSQSGIEAYKRNLRTMLKS